MARSRKEPDDVPLGTWLYLLALMEMDQANPGAGVASAYVALPEGLRLSRALTDTLGMSCASNNDRHRASFQP